MYLSEIRLEVPWEQDVFDWLYPKTFHVKDRKTGKTARLVLAAKETREFQGRTRTDPGFLNYRIWVRP